MVRSDAPFDDFEPILEIDIRVRGGDSCEKDLVPLNTGDRFTPCSPEEISIFVGAVDGSDVAEALAGEEVSSICLEYGDFSIPLRCFNLGLL